MEDKEKELPREEVPLDEGMEASRPASPPAGPSAEAGGQDEAAELKDRLAYLAAEFDNFRKRAAREREAQAAFGNEQLLRAILPFLDNLERAMGQQGASNEALLSGVRMTHERFLAELRKFGLEPISAEGRPFDPILHEAIASVPWGGKAEGTVLTEARKGYLLNGRLLRPAQVTVAAPPPDEGPGEPPAETGN